MSAPVITFLSDYGHSDEFVGVCHGVILRRCPQAHLIDITHGIARHDIRAGALTLQGALPFMPEGVHLAVVDPDVGAKGEHARRAIALLTADEQLLVGPDNGLLMPAAERLGGVLEAVDIGHSRERLEPLSATFHGRDIFAPVAGALAAGVPLAEVGDPLPVDDLIVLNIPRAQIVPGQIHVQVLHQDHFGNLMLNADHCQLAQAGFRLGQWLNITTGERALTVRYARAFADVPPGQMILYEDAQRMAALAVNRGSAAQILDVNVDATLSIGAK